MLKILFHRSGFLVRFFEAFGVVNSLLFLRVHSSMEGKMVGLYLFLVASYLFIRFCVHWPWYKKEDYPEGDPRRIGIQVHFDKALVPASYILLTASLFALLEVPYVSTFSVALADLMMLVLITVNGILIYYHLRDRDPLPINYFSLNKYLKETLGPRHEKV